MVVQEVQEVEVVSGEEAKEEKGAEPNKSRLTSVRLVLRGEVGPEPYNREC